MTVFTPATRWAGSATTAADGTYTVAALTPGEYLVEFSDCQGTRYLSEWWDEAASAGAATPVTVSAPSAVLDESLVPAATISGRVSADADPTLGISDYCVLAYVGEEIVGTATTGTDGAYVLGGLRAGSYDLRFADCGDRGYPAEWWDDAAERAGATTVVVAPGETATADAGVDTAGPVASGPGSISGQVLQPDGSPASGACVQVNTADSSYGGYVTTAAANTDGSFTVSGLSAGSYHVGVYPSPCRTYDYGHSAQWHPAVPNRFSAERVPVLAGQDTGGLQLRLYEEGSISGRTISDAGNPVADVCVQAEAMDFIGGTSSTSASDGSYELTGLAPGRWRVKFAGCSNSTVLTEYWRDAQDATTAATIVVGSGAAITGIDPRLTRMGSVAGRVLSDGGDPLAQVCVTATPIDNEGSGGPSTWSAPDGSYELRGVAPGRWRLRFGCGGDERTVSEFWADQSRAEDATPIEVVSGAAVTGIDARLTLTGAISGVIRSDGGNPIAGVCVQAESLEGATRRYSHANSGAAGAYTIGGLAPGRWRLWFYGCGSASVRAEYWQDAQSTPQASVVTVTAGGTTSGIDPRLTLLGSVSGTVTDAAGGPAAGACVRLWSGPVESSWSQVSTSGDFAIGDIVPGSYQLRFGGCGEFVEEWYADSATQAGAQTITITEEQLTVAVKAQLTRLGKVTGVVRNDIGEPLPNACVRAYDAAGNEVAMAEADATGNYTASGFETGSFRLKASDRCSYYEVARQYADEWFADAESFEAATPVDVTIGTATTGTDFSLPRGASIAGRVTNSQGLGLSAYCVTYIEPGGTWSSARTASDGTYTIGGLSAGTYRLGAYHCGSGVDRYAPVWWESGTDETSATPFELAADEQVTGRDLVLPAYGSISGTVRDASGNGLSQVCVDLIDPSGAFIRQVRTSSSGAYLFLRQRPGDYRIGFSIDGICDDTWAGEYHADATDLASATVVSLPEATNVGGIDAVLTPASTGGGSGGGTPSGGTGGSPSGGTGGSASGGGTAPNGNDGATTGSSGMRDVPDGYWAAEQVRTLLEHGVTSGCHVDGDTVYFCPDDDVSRQQMAVFLARAAGVDGANLPAATGAFADVPASSSFAPYIEWAAREGITVGCGTDSDGQAIYCPSQPVLRSQMAVFLTRALGGEPAGAARGVFEDVPRDAGYASFAEWVFDRGITSGCRVERTARFYCPDRTVTRAQMAVFLVDAFGLGTP